MTQDDRVLTTLDRLLAELRGAIDAHLRSLVEDLTARFAEERQQAVEQATERATAEIRRQAQVQVGQLRDAHRQQLDAARRAADAEIASIREKAAAEIEEARRAGEARALEAERALGERLAALGSDLESARARAVQASQEAERARRELDTARHDAAQARAEAESLRQAVEQARHDADEVRRELSALQHQLEVRSSMLVVAEQEASRLAQASADFERRLAEAVSRAQREAVDGEIQRLGQLASALRALDAAHSLKEVLEQLAQHAGRHAPRAAILLVRGDRLQVWKLVGFPGSVRPADISRGEAGVVAAALRDRQAVARSGRGDGPHIPSFAVSSGAREAIGLPVVISGEVVAALYADAPRANGGSDDGRWRVLLDVLALHASRVLEAMTVRQSAAAGVRAARAGQIPPRTFGGA